MTTYGTALASAVLSFVNVVLVSRPLGPAGRGEVVFLMTVAALTAFVSALSVEEANANLVGLMPRARRALATNSLVMAIALGAAGAGAVYATVRLLPSLRGDTSLGLLSIALASVPVIIVQNYLLMFVRADYRFAVANAATLVAPVFNVTVNGLLTAVGAITVTTALITWIAGQAIAAAVLAWHVARRLAGFGRPDVRLAGQAVGFGLKVHGSSSLSAVNFRLDHLILGVLVGPRELGLYSVAVAYFEALFFLPMALAFVLRPYQVRSTAAEAHRRVARVFRIATIVTIPLVVVLAIAAPLLCVTIFGEEFRGSVLPLQLLAPGALGIVALKLMGNTLVAQRRPLLETAAIGMAFLATVVLDFLLIPRYGAVGAALASTLAYTVAGVAVATIFLRALGGPKRDLLPGGRDLPDALAEVGAALSALRPRTDARPPP